MERENKRLAYQGKIEAELKEWGSQIDRWQERNASDMQAVISDLNSKRQAVRRKLAEMKDTDDGQWQNMQAELDQAVEDMRRVMEATRAQIH
jgi:hypothetical protein